MKISFTMTAPERKKHSSKFHFGELRSVDPKDASPELEGFRPVFYIPKPVGDRSKTLLVTIEEL
jgi:hypothetical protein